jgi:hypothetical protein
LAASQRPWWRKKVRGRFHYFGKANEKQAALERWLDVKDDLLAGRTPAPKGDGLTVADLCNHFLTYKKQLHGSGQRCEEPVRRFE